MRILFIQAEYANLDESFPWAFSIRGDLIESMRVFAQVDVLYSTEIHLNLNSWISNYCYDVIFLNDVNHININEEGGWNTLSLPQLLNIKNNNIKIIANSFETLFHTNLEYQNIYSSRIIKFLKLKDFFSGVITYDYFDYMELKKIGINSFYRPFSLNQENFMDWFSRPKKEYDLLFMGTLYGPRVKFINQSIYKDQITLANLPHSEYEINNSMHLKKSLSNNVDNLQYQNLSSQLEFLKKEYSLLFMKILSSANVIINLPSIFQGISCRAVESIYSESVFLTSYPRTSIEVNLLKNNENCFFYNEQSIEDFDNVIGFLKDSLNIGGLHNLDKQSFDSIHIMGKIISFIEDA